MMMRLDTIVFFVGRSAIALSHFVSGKFPEPVVMPGVDWLEGCWLPELCPLWIRGDLRAEDWTWHMGYTCFLTDCFSTESRFFLLFFYYLLQRPSWSLQPCRMSKPTLGHSHFLLFFSLWMEVWGRNYHEKENIVVWPMIVYVYRHRTVVLF